MARVMGTCGGLVGPKTENVEKPLVLPLLFEGRTKGRRRFHCSEGEEFGWLLGPNHEIFD